MGYLSNSTVTVEAILTTRGRELLSKGLDYFKISQFALADDEIDYTLYDTTHPLGSNYYGQAIENLPLVEAYPDADQLMKYKLITLPKGSKFIPTVSVPSTAITLSANAKIASIAPSTANIPNGNSVLGYTVILSDSTIADLVVAPGGAVAASTATVPTFLSDDGTARSISVVGTKFELRYKSQTTDKVGSVIIIGNETGGRVTIALTVLKDSIFNSLNQVDSFQ